MEEFVWPIFMISLKEFRTEGVFTFHRCNILSFFLLLSRGSLEAHFLDQMSVLKKCCNFCFIRMILALFFIRQLILYITCSYSCLSNFTIILHQIFFIAFRKFKDQNIEEKKIKRVAIWDSPVQENPNFAKCLKFYN